MFPVPSLDAYTARHGSDFPCGYTAGYLTGDMSPRRYFRLICNEGRHPSKLAMSCPDGDILGRFAAIQAYLSRDADLRTPAIYHIAEDYAVIEDLGDFTLSRSLDSGSPGQQAVLYRNAVDVLVRLYRNAPSSGKITGYVPAHYNSQRFMQDAPVFTQWYIAYIRPNMPPDSAQEQEWHDMWHDLLAQALTDMPCTFVLRDYMADNIMHLNASHPQEPPSLAVIDFQDGLWGPAVFDVMSLIHDVRRDIDPSLRQELWDYYCKGCGFKDSEGLYRKAAVLSAFNLLRIMGVFTRYALKHGNPSKLEHLPRAAALLQGCFAAAPELAPVRRWLDGMNLLTPIMD